MSINKLPDNMLARITATECPVPGLEGMCWSWTGATNSKGYGSVGIGKKKTALTHRVLWELHNGPIPVGLQLDHLCRNIVCCNPHHLEPVTAAVNVQRAYAATKVRCKHGHALAGPNLRIKPKTAGTKQRQCRVCEMDNAERYNEKNKLGVRRPSLSKAARRACQREWLLDAGEAALAGRPIPPKPTPDDIEAMQWELEEEQAEQELADEYRDNVFVRSWLGIEPPEGERNLTLAEMQALPEYPAFMARLESMMPPLGEAS